MKTHRFLLRIPLLCSLGLLGLGSMASAQWATQTLQLQNGWNAVYLRVTPSPAACDQVFAGLPVIGAYCSNTRNAAAQFDTDPTQLFLRPDEWLTWVPKAGDSSYVRTLQNLVGGSAYLIHTTNACVLSLKGRPVIPRFEWVPGRANLVGFQVSPYPELQPTFAEFFRYEPAIDGSQDFASRRIMQIGPALEYTNLTGQTTHRKIEPGRAYWIQAQALSRYVGPLSVSTTDPNGLIYGEEVNELILQVSNVCDPNAPPITVTFRHVNSEAPPPGAPPRAGAVPLLYVDNTGSNFVWRPWPTDQSQSRTLTGGQVLTMRLAINRGALSPPTPTNALWQSLLQISGSSGTFIQVPLSAAFAGGNDRLAQFPYGLWVGQANINQVSCVRFDTNTQGEAASAPLPAGGTFPLRLIIHAGSDGNCRLLSSAVIAALQDSNSNTVNRIYTDANLVSAAATVLTRISSAGFGRIAPVGLSGPGFLNALSGDYTLSEDDPLNPFKHIYHPDHTVGFTISNHVALTWNTLPDPTLGATLWNPGETTTGTYEHQILNLRHTPILLRGSFTLNRVSRVGSAQ